MPWNVNLSEDPNLWVRRPLYDCVIMVVVTGLTNFAMAPCIRLLHRRGQHWEAFCGGFTCATSFMYHICDSLHSPLWLSEGAWHRLDNIGSITCFGVWAIYLSGVQSAAAWSYANFLYLALVIILQEKAPWDERFTFGPIVLSFVCAALKVAFFGAPKYNSAMARRGAALLICAFMCFARGLDDKTDTYRFFHGCWHLFIGAASYYNWQIVDSVPATPRLPLTRASLKMAQKKGSTAD